MLLLVNFMDVCFGSMRVRVVYLCGLLILQRWYVPFPCPGPSHELTDTQKEQFEMIARNEYTKSDEKNPIDCSLFYIALKKKTVLQGLWRMAGWNREQVATLKLLSNNFQEEKWKTVALKNAYALLGKHRCSECWRTLPEDGY